MKKKQPERLRDFLVFGMTQDKPKNKAAQDLGSLGGKAGKGAAKRRSPQHYAKMVTARAEQRKARAEEEKHGMDL